MVRELGDHRDVVPLSRQVIGEGLHPRLCRPDLRWEILADEDDAQLLSCASRHGAVGSRWNERPAERGDCSPGRRIERCKEGAIELVDVVEQAWYGVPRQYFATSRTEEGAKGTIAGQPFELVGHCGHVPGGNEEARLSVANDVPYPADVGRDDRLPCSQRFDHGDRCALIRRRQSHCVDCGVDRRDVLAEADEVDVGAQTGGRGPGLECWS